MNTPAIDFSASGGHVNPFMATFNGTSVTAYHQWETKPLEEITAEEERISRVLRKAAMQVTERDGVMNFDGLDMWSGDTQEKTHKLIEIHSQLCGVRAALNGKRQAKQIEEMNAADLIRRNAPNGGNGTGHVNDLNQIDPTQFQQRTGMMPSEALAQACEEQHGMGLGAALEAYSGRVLAVDRTFDEMTPGHVFKAAVFETGDWDPFITREPGWIPSRQRPIQVSDIVTIFMTAKDAIQWMEETTYSAPPTGQQTSGAAARIDGITERAEGEAVGESAYSLTERSESVRRIAHYLPVTEESLADEPQVRGYLDYVMPLGVRQRLDGQIINGSGAAPNIAGILAYGFTRDRGTAGSGLDPHQGGVAVKKYTRASGANGRIAKPWNVLLEANYQIRDHGMGILGMQVPTHAVLNPNIYLECLLSESSSGGYYIGGPASPLLDRAWGMDVVQTTHLTDARSTNGKANRMCGGIIGDFSPMFIRMYLRHDVRTEFGYISDDFQRFRISIRSSCRGALAVMRAAAFCALVNPIAAGTAPTD